MAVFGSFFPDMEMDSVYQIDFAMLYHEGIRGVIFDIDNTLVEHGADADDRAKTLFRNMKELGLDACLLSNNKQPRVERFNRDIGVHMIWKANKPAAKNYYRAMELMGTDLKSTIFIGDQLFTDVWGARKIGMKNILVHPINKKEEIQIVLKRRLEKIVLHSYHKNCGK